MSDRTDSGPPENADKSQEVSGLYIPLPVTDEQAARMYGAYCASELPSRGEATEAALRVVGIEITPPPEDLKPVAYVNAQRLRWKLSTGSSVCMTFSAEPWHGGGSLDLIDGIVFSKDHESVVRHLNVCLSEQERAILGLTDQIAEKDRHIAELEGEIALARQSPAPPLEAESGEHEGDRATSALSDTLRAAEGQNHNNHNPFAGHSSLTEASISDMGRNLGRNLFTAETIHFIQRIVEDIAKQSTRSRAEQVENLAKAIRRMWRSSDTSAKNLAAQHIAEAEQRVVNAISAKIATIPASVVTEISELPDRTSPEECPQMMLVTAEELTTIVRDALASIGKDLNA